MCYYKINGLDSFSFHKKKTCIKTKASKLKLEEFIQNIL